MYDFGQTYKFDLTRYCTRCMLKLYVTVYFEKLSLKSCISEVLKHELKTDQFS